MEMQIEEKLFIFERKILWKIFGPYKQADGSWRIKTNEELDKLVKEKNIVREIKSRSIIWLERLERMEKHGLTKKFGTQTHSFRPRGRPRMKWEMM
jgi:hypothetical protein